MSHRTLDFGNKEIRAIGIFPRHDGSFMKRGYAADGQRFSVEAAS